ncbi:hypothetical protein OIU85_003725 [Salix viminalis]|uniref:Uncharacterized protein n=1 Tax=Salix viminalis TaxID=40686 RepID=A0A9Q0Q010_SALVM|nr:hypothetical protein OIU85_003725 [Salix viminalis]
MEDDFNFTSNQFGYQASEDNFNMFEFPSSPPEEEVPVNQSSILCNDQAGQSGLVDNNDSIQQTTQFPQTMTTMGGLDGTSSSCINQNRPNWPQTPSRSQMENLQVVHVLQNQTARPNASNFGPDSSLQSQNRGLNTQQMEGAPPSSREDDRLELDTLMSELLLSPAEEVPENQSSMLCNDQVGQNMLVDNNDSIQQTTQFPPSFLQTMTTMGSLDGTSSSWINQNGPNWPQTASSDQQWTNQLAMSNQVPGMLPQPPMNQWSPQFPPHNIQVSEDHDLFISNCYDSTLFEPTSSSRYPISLG